MRLKVPFYRFLLGAVCFLLPLVVFAALLPTLINADPVKKRFMQELKSWTGAGVRIVGPVAIESFFSLSLNAENVEFRGLRRLPNLKGVKAGRIVARIAWTDLLWGKLDFDKIKIYDATVQMTGMGDEDAADALIAMLTAPYETPFEVFLLSNSRVEIEGGGRAPRQLDVRSLVVDLDQSDQRIELRGRFGWDGEQVELQLVTYAFPVSPGAVSRPLRFDLSSRLLNASFDGRVTSSGAWSANGQASVSTPDAEALSEWLGRRVAAGIAGAVRIAGALDVSEERVHLRSGTVSAGTAEATGEIAVLLTREAPHLEGSIAFDRLDLGAFRFFSRAGASAARFDQTALARYLHDATIDLRISAKAMLWDRLTTGAAAFTLSGRTGALSAEIAQLDLLGGSMLGQVDADLRGDLPRVSARITAENIDSAQAMMILSQKDWLAGRADTNIEARAEGRTAEEFLKSGTMDARIAFPEGGQIRLDIARLAKSASVQGQDGWDKVDFSWADFSNLRFKLGLKDERLHWRNLYLQAAEGNVRGTGDIDFTERNLDWQLIVRPTAGGAAPDASLSIKGPWMRPVIRLGRHSGSAGQDRHAARDRRTARTGQRPID
jgi:AsmA protein